MSDGSLSQDEIDALLSGGFDSGIGNEVAPQQASRSERPKDNLEPLRNLLNKNSSNLSSVLEGLISDTVNLQLGTVTSSSSQGFISDLEDEIVIISANFSGDITGTHFYILSLEVATLVASKMMGLENADLDDAAISALEETGNVIAGSTVTLIGDEINKSINASSIRVQKKAKIDLSEAPSSLAKAVYQGTIDGLDNVEIIEVFSTDLVSSLFAAPKSTQQAQEPSFFGGGSSMDMNTVQFPSLNQKEDSKEYGNIGLLMDVFMEMTVELGRTKKLIKDILSMGEGTIIELDKLAGEPVDIFVNHKLIAKGEVVVIDENFGVRVTEIISPMERVQNMV